MDCQNYLPATSPMINPWLSLKPPRLLITLQDDEDGEVHLGWSTNQYKMHWRQIFFSSIWKFELTFFFFLHSALIIVADQFLESGACKSIKYLYIHRLVFLSQSKWHYHSTLTALFRLRNLIIFTCWLSHGNKEVDLFAHHLRHLWNGVLTRPSSH